MKCLKRKRTKYTKLLQENGVWDLLEIFKLADNMLTKWDGEEEKEKHYYLFVDYLVLEKQN